MQDGLMKFFYNWK